MWDQGLVELFLKGGIVMWPLLLCSVVGLALILERSLVALWISVPFRPLVRRLQQSVQDGKMDEASQRLARSRSPVARVAGLYLRHRDTPAALREEIVSREASQNLASLERRLSWLAMLAHVTPLLGLLGTVVGLMVAFQQFDLKGSHVQTSDLAGGIWQKLLNTAFGMAIAIPCLVAYYWLENRVGAVAQQMEWVTAYLNEWLSLPHGSTLPSSDGPSKDGSSTSTVKRTALPGTAQRGSP